MATIVYLDPDDEITSAAARIRDTADERVGLVIPFGSRVATSRINFRLLAREAGTNGKRLDLIAPDSSVRALAASAGLPVFASVGEYEGALEAGLGDHGSSSATLAAAAATASLTAAVAGGDPSRSGSPATPPALVPGPAELDAAREAELDEIVRRSRRPPVATGRRRGPGTGLVVGLLFLVLAIVAAGAGALVLLPSATITLTPHIEPVGPVAFTVSADPAATAVDQAAHVIPATLVEIPVEVSGEYGATGTRVEETSAAGTVRWSNCDPTAAYTISSGTIVRTASGTAFSVREQVFLPVAGLSGVPPKLQVSCTTSDVAVSAVLAGEGGNVPAGAIKVVPPKYNRAVVTVTNVSATKGGSRKEFPRVIQADIDLALEALAAQATATFEIDVESPDLVPAGTTVYPETAALGEPVPTVDPATLLGQEVKTFTLGLTATGTVLAVDPAPAQAIARAALLAAVDPGYELVDGTVKVAVGEGTVADGIVGFPVTGSARQIRPYDESVLRASLSGRTAAEVRAALAPYGDVTIVLWPDWATTVPGLDQRLTFQILEPVEIAPSATAEPAPDPTPDPTPGATSQ